MFTITEDQIENLWTLVSFDNNKTFSVVRLSIEVEERAEFNNVSNSVFEATVDGEPVAFVCNNQSEVIINLKSEDDGITIVNNHNYDVLAAVTGFDREYFRSLGTDIDELCDKLFNKPMRRIRWGRVAILLLPIISTLAFVLWKAFT